MFLKTKYGCGALSGKILLARIFENDMKVSISPQG